jgi:hypothetical protein
LADFNAEFEQFAAGTLDKVASLAREWFQHHLISEGPRMARARR